MTQQTNPCGCGSLPRTLITGRYAERPSPESSPLVAVSGGRAEAKRSRPERPALSKSAVGPARDCGPPGSGALLRAQLARPRAHVYAGSTGAPSGPVPGGFTDGDGQNRAKRVGSCRPVLRPLSLTGEGLPNDLRCATIPYAPRAAQRSGMPL